MKAVIPAAGLGTRFLPATKAQPKEMLPIVDKPAIQYVVEEAVNSGIDDILIITGRGKRSIEDHFDRAIELEHVLASRDNRDLANISGIIDFVDIYYIRQKTQKGLGHAIWCSRKHVGNEFFSVLLGDDIIINPVPCTKQLIDAHKKYGASVIAVQDVPRSRVDQYGIIKGEEVAEGVYRMSDMVEKPKPHEAASTLASIGRYYLSPTIFKCLEETPAGHGNELQLTDALRNLLKKEDIYALVSKGRRYDIGHKIDLIKATLELGMEREEFKDELREFLKKMNVC